MKRNPGNAFYRRIWALAAAAAVLVCLSVGASARLDPPEPTEAFYVADFANVLTQETASYIVEQNDALYQQTGAQIVVATVDFLDGEEIEDYARILFNDWEIGSKEKNNGVLMLLAIGEENYHVVQGKGLEKSFSSGVIKSILNEYLEPDFAAARYDEGVRKTFDAILDTVSKIYGGSSGGNVVYQEEAPRRSRGTGFIGVALAIVIIGFIIVFNSVMAIIPRRRHRGGFGGYSRSYRGFRPPPPPPPPGMFGGPFGRPPRRPPSGFGGGFGGGRGGFGGGGSHRSGGSSHRSGGGGSTRGGGAGRG